ncbi:NAD-dependent epimerase/dehydratase family protein [Bacillus sp. AK128]
MEEAIVMGTFSFLGYHLITRLLEDGVIVHGVNLEITPTSEKVKEEMEMGFGRNANFHSHEEAEWEQFLNRNIDKNINYVFYCLNITSNEATELTRASDYLNKAIEYCQSNSKTLIIASSMEVVDHENQAVITESSAIKPNTLRGKGYVVLEDLIRKKYEEKRFPYLILRFPTIYGPGQPEHNVYQLLLNDRDEDIREELKVEYKGDVLYISDAVEAFVKGSKAQIQNETIHVTSGKKGDWEKGLSLINNKEFEQSKKSITFDHSKAKNLLDFTPQVLIEEGIERQRQFRRSFPDLKWKN